MKIMVTGHTGMLGKEVVKAVERMGHEAMSENFDITEKIIWDFRPEVVINCAGLVPQRNPAPSFERLMQVNGRGPWNLADWCDDIGARLIQVSTDCVFDGAGAGPHSESKGLAPHGRYGYSKMAGEVDREPHLTVRTSFVGFGERGLITELEDRMKRGVHYNANNNLLWTGHTARFVAEILVILAERGTTGLLHIPGETLTRYQLVLKLSNILDFDELQVHKVTLARMDRRLASERWAEEGLPDLPSFEWQLEWLRRSR